MSLDGHIRLLPVQVANKIAAGEVVERPASAVKELVENALDAGATHIEVLVTAGGRKLIEVRDDGSGMIRDDALLSIERQATSKLRDVDDIERIATLGFRGEALPSIASVSRFTLCTCRRGETVGTELNIIGGRLQDVKDAGVPAGTTVSVRDLFFNVPARRKFLRAYETEQAHIRTVFILHALAHPEVGMLLKADGREIYRLPAGSMREDRVRDLFGAEFLAALRPVERTIAGVRVHGFAGLPTFTRADRTEQYIFVNSRPASAAVVPYALREAYPPLEAERKPVVMLFLELDPELVDVNVHPTKKEVRFRRSADVREAIIAAVSSALGHTPRRPVASAFDRRLASLMPAAPAPPLPVPVPPRENLAQALPWPAAPAQGTANVPASDGDSAATLQPPAAPVHAPPFAGEMLSSADTSPWKWCRVMGQIGGLYVLLETDAGYVVLDPRAAHERVLYERLMEHLKGGASSSQRMLLPETIKLPPEDATRVRRHLPLLQSMGFGVDDFGDDHFVVDALPAEVQSAPCRELLLDIAHDLESAGARRGSEKWREETVIRAACSAAVAGRKSELAPQELVQLVNDLARCRMPYTCPRGRPTMLLTPYRELARKFGR
ncbi:MAG: DNA mismatch repair endonuclease MutL [Kiritimatiellia bacterium]